MGQEVRGVPEAPALGASEEAGGAGAAPESIGRHLARQRELRGISLDELAALTKIPRRSLERLEAGAFDGTRDGFVRGFVRTVAAALGLDPDETVLRLLGEPDGDDERRAGAAGPPVSALAAGLVLALALLGLGAFLLVRSGEEGPSASPERGPVLREDPVRALAREQADADAGAP